jgi:hypothetical protein
VGEGGERRYAPVREVKEAALCACDADVVKMCVCTGGSAVPAERDFHETAESCGKGRVGGGRGTGRPYAKAATGPEERDLEQPKRKRKEEMGGWAHENAWMWTEGCWTRDVNVVEGAERIDVAVPIRLVDLRYKTSRSTTTTHTSSPLPTALPSTQAAHKLACLSSHHSHA